MRFFAAAGWARDDGCFSDVRSHGKANGAQGLNALGNRVHQFVLFVVVFIKEQMKLVEGMPRDLPMVLLVKIAKRNRVREDLVQILRAGRTYLLIQRNRQLCDPA